MKPRPNRRLVKGGPASRLTIRQRLVRSLSKRIKVVRDGTWGWRINWDGKTQTWTSSCRDVARRMCRHDIEREATKLLSDMRALQRQGFKVIFPL